MQPQIQIPSTGCSGELGPENGVDPAMEKQAMDLAYGEHPLPVFDVKPIIATAVFLAGIMVIAFLVGVGIALGYSHPKLEAAKEFDAKLKKALETFPCIPEDVAWPECENVCGDGIPKTSFVRTLQVLHAADGANCSNLPLTQKLECIDTADVEKRQFLDQWSPCVNGKKYQFRQLPPFFVFQSAWFDIKKFFQTEQC